MPATSIPNLGQKWGSATCEFLTKKNAAEPLLRLLHNQVARIFSGESTGSSPPLVYWNHWVGKNSVADPDLKEVKARI
jgi:hypothetical protein